MRLQLLARQLALNENNFQVKRWSLGAYKPSNVLMLGQLGLQFLKKLSVELNC